MRCCELALSPVAGAVLHLARRKKRKVLCEVCHVHSHATILVGLAGTSSNSCDSSAKIGDSQTSGPFFRAISRNTDDDNVDDDDGDNGDNDDDAVDDTDANNGII